MTSWSFLYDAMSEQKYDDITLTSNISEASESDYLDFWGVAGADTIPYDLYSSGEDTISFEIPDLPDAPKNDNGFWKYHEDVILKEIREYLGGTYRSHYASQESQTQTLDLIEGIGDAEPFCRSNAIKYLSRFGKKNGKSKQDILKAIHYCILLYHFAGLCNENSQPYETF
jgi:hypothetical protein